MDTIASSGRVSVIGFVWLCTRGLPCKDFKRSDLADASALGAHDRTHNTVHLQRLAILPCSFDFTSRKDACTISQTTMVADGAQAMAGL
jgi:hypothetical protein